jgi:hypothetical protein
MIVLESGYLFPSQSVIFVKPPALTLRPTPIGVIQRSCSPVCYSDLQVDYLDEKAS